MNDDDSLQELKGGNGKEEEKEKQGMVIMHTGEAETGLFYFFLQVYFI
jgi:hypothetical protein